MKFNILALSAAVSLVHASSNSPSSDMGSSMQVSPNNTILQNLYALSLNQTSSQNASLSYISLYWDWILHARLMWLNCWIRRVVIIRSLLRLIRRLERFRGSQTLDQTFVKDAAIHLRVQVQVSVVLFREYSKTIKVVNNNNNARLDAMTLPSPSTQLLPN